MERVRTHSARLILCSLGRGFQETPPRLRIHESSLSADYARLCIVFGSVLEIDREATS